MKKIILFIICPLIISGCFNYIEINNLVLISGIGIDYKNEKFIVNFEILGQNKEKSDSNTQNGIIKTGTGESIPQAFDDITLKLEKDPYLAHLKVVVISEEIAKNHIDDLFDFFLRNNDIRNIFSIVISNESSPEEVLSKTNKYYPVTSERIKNLLDNNVYSNYISQNKYFKNIVSNYLSKEKNITLSTIKIDKDELKLGDLAIFDNRKLTDYLNNDEALILSLIDDKKPIANFKYECKKDKYVIIRAYKSKTNFNIEKNKFTIKNNINAEVIENSCNINLENIQNQKELESIFEEQINKKINNLINHLRTKKSDILGLNHKYYIKYRKKNNNYFNNVNYNIKTNVNINKKGLIFEVEDDK